MPGNGDDNEITRLRKELDACIARNNALLKENQELKQELAHLTSQLSFLKAQNIERKSILWKKFQNSADTNCPDASPKKPQIPYKMTELSPAMGDSNTKHEAPQFVNGKESPTKALRPPPRTTSAVSPSKQVYDHKVHHAQAPSPPPPPPVPSKSLVGQRALRRVPQLLELYRLLTRRDTRNETKSNLNGSQAVSYPRNMIGEIENRSTYLSAIKSDVETYREHITFLKREVENAAYTEISDVETFVKWLDEELSYLVDERAVLKHFPEWPERKADAMREAACSYRDMKSLKSEIASFKDNPNQPLSQALRRMQTLQDRLEQSVNNMEKARESTIKRYRAFQIPWQWMLDTGIIGQMKLSSMKLANLYMKRITEQIYSNECSHQEDLMLQGVRFAFRVHQFAGGLDADTMDTFEELRKASMPNTGDKQNQDIHTPEALEIG